MNNQPMINNMPANQTLQTGMQNLGTSFEKAGQQMNNSFQSFSDQASAGAEATTGFLQSNTIIAKFAFIILVLIVFLILLSLGISLLSYFTAPSENPFVVKGLLEGNQAKVVPQDPKQGNSVQIFRSNNESSGAEFTWSTWLYISDLGNQEKKYQHIFSKGDGLFDPETNRATVNNSPGIYLEPMTNNLLIVMSTVEYEDTNNSIVIETVPLKKWFHVALRLQNKILDVYVNGVIAKRLIFNYVPKQNYSDIYINQNGGFNGFISNLRYFNHALNIFELNSIVKKGPNLNRENGSMEQKKFDYISNYWYTSSPY